MPRSRRLPEADSRVTFEVRLGTAARATDTSHSITIAAAGFVTLLASARTPTWFAVSVTGSDTLRAREVRAPDLPNSRHRTPDHSRDPGAPRLASARRAGVLVGVFRR